MLLVLCSFAAASAEWQTSYYASQVGLLIVYPKLDYYKITESNVTFNFNVFDENNIQLDSTTTECSILMYTNNGSRFLHDNLSFDGTNFYYIWDKSNFSTPQSLYYTVMCNQSSANGFMSNSFDINYDARNPLNNTNYLPIIICMLGMCLILLMINNSLDERHGVLKLMLLSFIVLFFIIFGVVLMAMMRGADLTFYSLAVFKTTSWILRIFFAYVLVFLIIVIFQHFGILMKMKEFMRMKK